MTFGGEPQDLRDLAAGLRRLAADVAQVQHRVASAQGVQWRGAAADRFVQELREQAARVEQSQAATVQAAVSLETLAAELEARQAAIRAAMATVELRVDQARRTLAAASAQALDRAGETVTHAERVVLERARRLLDEVGPLPVPGHPQWLGLATRLAGS